MGGKGGGVKRGGRQDTYCMSRARASQLTQGSVGVWGRGDPKVLGEIIGVHTHLGRERRRKGFTKKRRRQIL